MAFEHLFSELLVTSILHCIHLKSVRVGVHIMVLGKHVTHRPHCSEYESNHGDNNHGIWSFIHAHILQELTDIVSHLRSRGRSAIIVLYHTVMQLGRHCYDHMIEVGIEVTTFWHIVTKGRVVVVTCHYVVRIVDDSTTMGSSSG